MSSCSSITTDAESDVFGHNPSSNARNTNHSQPLSPSDHVLASSGSHESHHYKAVKAATKKNIFGDRNKIHYRPRGRNKYVDPALVVNRFERAAAKTRGIKPKFVKLPQVVANGEALKHRRRRPKWSAEQRHAMKIREMGINALSMRPLPYHTPFGSTKHRTRRHRDHHHAINRTASLYPQMLAQRDPSSFVHRHGNDLGLKVSLFPKYKHIADLDRHKSYSLDHSRTFKLIDRWYREADHGDDVYHHIPDDHELVRRCASGQLRVSSDAFKHRDCRVRQSRDALQEFRCRVSRLSGGKRDYERQATKFQNYRCIDICHRLSGLNGRPPSNHCVSCKLGLQAVPLYCIGTGELFPTKPSTPNHDGPSQDEVVERHQVHIYIIALLCDNYPCCTFPRSRRNFHKYWVKCAWYNDINGKEWLERAERLQKEGKAKERVAARRKEVKRQEMRRLRELKQIAMGKDTADSIGMDSAGMDSMGMALTVSDSDDDGDVEGGSLGKRKMNGIRNRDLAQNLSVPFSPRDDVEVIAGGIHVLSHSQPEVGQFLIGVLLHRI